MKWFTKKQKSGENSHFIPTEKVTRYASDDDNPITFAHGLDEDLNEGLDDFASEKKEEFKTNTVFETSKSEDKADYELAREIMNEADEIGESELKDEAKVVELYNLFQEQEQVLSDAQKRILLEKISGINKQMKLRGKNSKIASDIQNEIMMMHYGINDTRKPNKIQKNNSNQPSKQKESESNIKPNNDIEWDERVSGMMALAEIE